MREFWNERYAEEDYAYGVAPNHYFADKLAGLEAASLLLAAEGEGRTAVYAALKGWQVSAFDISQSGQQKALQLAKEKGVTLDYQVGVLEQVHFETQSFEALGLIYAHFPPAIRKKYHQQLATFLKPGAYLIFEAFSKNHLSYRAKNPAVGGPPTSEMLFSVEEVKEEFPDFEFFELEEKIIELAEGKYHNGTAAVIRCFAQKR